MNKRDFKSEAYTKWRKSVFKRDKYCCQHPGCNKKTGLNAHHIKRYANYIELRENPLNGITLCKYHHKQTFGREEDFEELYTKIVRKKTEVNIDILRFKHTGKTL